MKILNGHKVTQSFAKNFYEKQPAFEVQHNPLLGIRMAERWFELLKYGADEDVYNFQEVLQGKSSGEVVIRGKRIHMMSSYDYLGLIGHKGIEETAVDAIREYGTGTGGVRLLTGTNELHLTLERTIGNFKGTGGAVVLSSGYMANLAAIAGLFGKNDLVITDENIHRSITDAVSVAGVPQVNFRHNDTDSLREILEKYASIKRKLIIVEGIYSMDGDICPLKEIVHLKNEYDAFLMLDEAHSLGVLGKTGRGVDEHFGIDPSQVDIYTGSLAKAIPANGGFIAAKEEVIVYLKHAGSPYIFSAALSPANTAASLKALEILNEEQWRLEKLWQNTAQMMSGLKKGGINTGDTQSPVIPVICGLNKKTFKLSKSLFDQGYLANAVAYPAVPAKKTRLRLCCTANQKPEIIDQFTQTIGELYAQLSF